MSTASLSAVLPAERGALASLAVGGAAVGVLDGLFAVAVYVVALQVTTTERVFQAIASALLGRAAFEGGWATAALGVLLHFAVAYGWATVWLALHRRWPWLRRRVASTMGVLAASAVYGPLVWIAMQHVVVPLTRFPQGPIPAGLYTTLLVGHVFVVGLPIVALVRPRRR